MKDNFKLVAITVVFVLTGLVLSFFAMQDSKLGSVDLCSYEGNDYFLNEEIEGYKEDSTCFCSSGGIVECLPNRLEDADEEAALEATELETEGLNFEYNYLRGILNEEDIVVSPLVFTNVSFGDSSLIVVLEQLQLCPEANTASDQVGFYENIDGVIKLYNMIRPSNDPSSISCIVQLKYVFEEFGDLNLEDMQIAFIDDAGLLTYASMCIHNEKVYSDGDVFRKDDDFICTCEEGEITCEEELSD